MPSRIVRAAAFALALALACGDAPAEVPSLPEERLTEKAALVVTGKVTAVEARVLREDKDGSKTTRHTFTVEVVDVTKGELKDRAKPITVTGTSRVLKPRETGSTGHRSSNTPHRISQVAKGWELRLYLMPLEKGGADTGEVEKSGAYHIVFPNGFEVLKEAK